MDDQQPAQPKVGPRFVDDLAEASDYWMTLTDAARVTRRQEVTIRRWVAAGSLPVRRQQVGLNSRTRLVRASDLAHLTPIIDTAAAISGATAQVDLVSIPAQQAQILATHTVLQHDLMVLQSRLAQTLEQVANSATEHAAWSERLLAQINEVRQTGTEALQEAQTHWRQDLHAARQELAQQLAALTALDATQHHEEIQRSQAMLAQIGALDAQLTTQHATFASILTNHQTEWTHLFAQLRGDLAAMLTTQQRNVQRQLADLATQMVRLEERLAAQNQQATEQQADERQWRVAKEQRLLALHQMLRRLGSAAPRTPHRRLRRKSFPK